MRAWWVVALISALALTPMGCSDDVATLSDGSAPLAARAITCPAGYYRKGNRCVKSPTQPPVQCPDGTTVPAGTACPPPPPPPTQTCWDGSVIPTTQQCPVQPPPPPPPVQCPDGTQVPAGQTCPVTPPAPPPVTCPDGSTLPAGSTCPVVTPPPPATGANPTSEIGQLWCPTITGMCHVTVPTPLPAGWVAAPIVNGGYARPLRWLHCAGAIVRIEALDSQSFLNNPYRVDLWTGQQITKPLNDPDRLWAVHFVNDAGGLCTATDWTVVFATRDLEGIAPPGTMPNLFNVAGERGLS